MTYPQFFDEWNSEVPFVICHTSGSTGIPSAIKLTKKEMQESAQRTCDFFNINHDSLLYSCISPDYIGGKMMLIRSLLSGAEFGYEEPSNHPLEKYDGKPIDLLSIVPSQMLFILDHPEISHKVKAFLIGGSAIPDEIRKRIIQNNINAYESYGMTETSSHIALKKIDENSRWFKTLGNISVYHYQDDKLAIRIGEKNYFTNDIAVIKNESEFRIIGRADNVIITGGKKVFPEEVEKKIQSILNTPFYITSRKDIKWGEKVILVTSDQTHPDAQILKSCREVLIPHEMPKEIVRVDSLPLTPNGKIKRLKFS